MEDEAEEPGRQQSSPASAPAAPGRSRMAGSLCRVIPPNWMLLVVIPQPPNHRFDRLRGVPGSFLPSTAFRMWLQHSSQRVFPRSGTWSTPACWTWLQAQMHSTSSTGRVLGTTTSEGTSSRSSSSCVRPAPPEVRPRNRSQRCDAQDVAQCS